MQCNTNQAPPLSLSGHENPSPCTRLRGCGALIFCVKPLADRPSHVKRFEPVSCCTYNIHSSGVSPDVASPQLRQHSQGLLRSNVIVGGQQTVQEVLDAPVQLLIPVLLICTLDICRAAVHQLLMAVLLHGSRLQLDFACTRSFLLSFARSGMPYNCLLLGRCATSCEAALPGKGLLVNISIMAQRSSLIL